MSLPSPDPSAWLVTTKLHPPLLRGDTIRRPRLEEALSHSVRTLPLTLLSAPAGYGKTTMLAALPHLLPTYPLAWVTLDAEDNDPVRFIWLLAAALQRLHPGCGQSVRPCLAGGVVEGSSLNRAIGTLIQDIHAFLQAPFILVLDDLHFVTEPGVYVALEYLLEHLPPQMHVAVGTRHDPPLRLARMMARRQLGELRRPDLGFSQAEAQLLLNDTMGLNLSATDVAALQERTEGWPAGLCLLAGPLGRLGTPAGRTQFMAHLAHTERYALEFLAEEVLRDLPGDLRRFLLETSVLVEMTPSACRAVTGRADAGEVLEGLYRQNLTIAAIDSEVEGEPVYRHHALFARLLARQLARELPAEMAELHRRAAGAQKIPGRTIAHYLLAGSWDEAAELVLQAAMVLIHQGMGETIRTWYSALPAEARARHPRLGIVMAACEIGRGDFAAAAHLLNRACEVFVAMGDAVGEGDAMTTLITLSLQNDDRQATARLVTRALELPLPPLGQVSVRLARAWLHLLEGEWAAIQPDMREALTITHEAGNRPTDLVGVTYMNALMAAAPGCLEISERYFERAAALAPPDTAWRLGALELSAWPLLWRGHTAEALAKAGEAEALRQRLGGHPFVGIDAAVVLAVLHIARGDVEAAGRALEALIQRMDAASRSKLVFYRHAAGRAQALLGRRAEAQASLHRLAALSDGGPLARYLCEHLGGLIALLDGRPAEAAASLSRGAALEAELPIAWVGGSARLLHARLLLEQGRPDVALATVSAVVGEWDQAGLPGAALLDGPAALTVLRLAAQRGVAGAARMVALFPQTADPLDEVRPSPSPVALLEPLTQRESNVLRLVVAGYTNRQIGEALFITGETVKSHMARILRKLDVTSRTQAAIRGRELGF